MSDFSFTKTSFEEGLDLIAQVAYPVGLVKRAAGIPGLEQLTANLSPEARNALMWSAGGAGVGAGLGGLSSIWQTPGRRKPISRMLTGALLGGLMGGAVPMAQGMSQGLDRGILGLPGLGGLEHSQPNRMAPIEQAEAVKQQLHDEVVSKMTQPNTPPPPTDLAAGDVKVTPTAGSEPAPAEPTTTTPPDIEKAVSDAQRQSTNLLGVHTGWENRNRELSDGTQVNAQIPTSWDSLGVKINSPFTNATSPVGKALQEGTTGSVADLSDLAPPLAGAGAGYAASRGTMPSSNNILNQVHGGGTGGDNLKKVVEDVHNRLGGGMGNDQVNKLLLQHGSDAPRAVREQSVQQWLKARQTDNLARNEAAAQVAQGRPATAAREQAEQASQNRHQVAQSAINQRRTIGREPGGGVNLQGPALRDNVRALQREAPRTPHVGRGIATGAGTAILTRLLLNHFQGKPAPAQ